ncbi:hypothetical protein, partial [Amycolatopsis mediterranei]
MLLAYATIMHNARKNWLNRAEGLVKAVQKKHDGDVNALLQVLVTMAGAVFVAAVGVVAVLEVAVETGVETIKQEIGGDSYEEIADSYFAACRALRHQVDEAIEQEVASRLTPLTDERPVPPLSPLDTSTFETHPRVLVPP